MLYQDAFPLPVLHDRLPSTDKILFALRPFYKRSQRWMTPTKKVQMHKESTNAQRWNVCTIEIRMHASDGIRAEKDKCTKYYSFWPGSQEVTGAPHLNQRPVQFLLILKSYKIVLSVFCTIPKRLKIVLLVFSILPKMLRNNTYSIFYHPKNVKK